MNKTKIFLISAIALLSVAALPSCSKSDPTPPPVPDTPVVPETGTVALESIKVTAPEPVKATEDGTSVVWSEGDNLALYTGNDASLTSSSKYVFKENTTFTHDGKSADPYKEDGYFYAVYPASALSQWGEQGEKSCYVQVPEQQTATTNGYPADATVLAGGGTEENITMHHITAYFKFTIDASSSDVSSVELKTAANSFLYGKAIVGGIGAGVPVASTTFSKNEPRNSVKLSAPAGKTFAPGSYYIAILPCEISGEVSVYFRTNDSRFAVKKIKGPIKFESGKAYDYGKVEGLEYSSSKFTQNGIHLEQEPGKLAQVTGYHCGPHSIMQCIYKLTGFEIDEKQLGTWAGTNANGTGHPGLETCLKRFNSEKGFNIKMKWYDFKNCSIEQIGQWMENPKTAIFFHLLYRDQWGHYELPYQIDVNSDRLLVANSLGNYYNGKNSNDGYYGYIEDRSWADQKSYISGISQLTVCVLSVD